ncbi:MAG TPA: MurR/RpiR family transcriptional regulator, partial [Acidimicrobiales bacterium]|nr:MurR/RpiR family transcriptional regulator [Acidimicrobiales bacterium]
MRGVADRIRQHADHLTATERRIAEVIATEPQTIAFGTVALVAQRAGTSGPSVVRLAVKLGYGGFVELQADVQSELARQLASARDRIRQQPDADLLSRVATTEQLNVSRTLADVRRDVFDAVVTRLADPSDAVWILSGDATAPVGATLAGLLGQLRAGVTELRGSAVAVARSLGGLRPGDTLVAMDIRRYERWLAEAVRWAVGAGAVLVTFTDSPLSPLAPGAAHTVFLATEAVGPFDSMTGGLALANAVAAGVAARLRATAPDRLDVIETAWAATAALLSEPADGPSGAERRSGADAERGAGGSAEEAAGLSAGEAAYQDGGQRDLVGNGAALGDGGPAGDQLLQLLEQAPEPAEG